MSRNNLKLPDVARAAELVHGDQLLRADRILAVALDGVYRRGEIYLRWLQQLVSLLFGTRAGRFFTRALAVPFGGAYVILAGADHLMEMFHLAGVEFKTPQRILFMGVFLLATVNVAIFRRFVWETVRTTFRAVRILVVDWPCRLLALDAVQRVLRSGPAILLVRFLLKPAAWTLILWLLAPGIGRNWQLSASRAAVLFLGLNLILNSRAGRKLEEATLDWLSQAWHRFGLRPLVNLFALVMDVFRELLEAVERLLYTVDEWLRFKSGESQLMLGLKAGMGLVWFIVTYVVRFCVNLLIEPQVNPIKHFPVVTVSHKFLLPFIPQLAGVLEYTLDRGAAWTLAPAIIWSIPGIFGFLVWELKENWRLYAANRPDRLGPVVIGSHGETMPRLLKRGLHSGTLPKRFAKLRRAERKARLRGNWKAVHKHLLALHHVELSLRRYLQRELVELLRQGGWHDAPLSVEHIHLGPGLVRFQLASAMADPDPLLIGLEVRSGWLLAGVTAPGWTQHLDDKKRRILSNAILGLYKTSGVDLVYQHLEAALPQQSQFTLSDTALVVWPLPHSDREVRDFLGEQSRRITPRTPAARALEGLPRAPPFGSRLPRPADLLECVGRGMGFGRRARRCAPSRAHARARSARKSHCDHKPNPSGRLLIAQVRRHVPTMPPRQNVRIGGPGAELVRSRLARPRGLD